MTLRGKTAFLIYFIVMTICGGSKAYEAQEVTFDGQ